MFPALRWIHALSVERDCAESQSQQHLRLAATPNLLRLVLRTQPRSGLPAKFTDNLRMHCPPSRQSFQRGMASVTMPLTITPTQWVVYSKGSPS